jgi:tetratricopeptide (TPR) repeat protein
VEENKMDDSSPIFVIQTQKEITEGNLERASELCNRGLQYFPDYHLGYILLAEVYERLGNFEQRDATINKALSLFPTNFIVKSVYKRILKDGRIISENITSEVNESQIILENSRTLTTDNELGPTGLEQNLSDFDNQKTNENNNFEDVSSSFLDDVSEMQLTDEIVNKIEEQNLIEEEIEEIVNSEIDEIIESEIEEELYEITKNEHQQYIPFIHQNITNLNNLFAVDYNLIPGVNFLPFQFPSFSQKYYSQITEPFLKQPKLEIDNKINLNTFKEKVLSNTSVSQDIQSQSDTFFEEMVNSLSDTNNPLSKFAGNDQESDTKQEEYTDFFPTETYAKILEKQNKIKEAISIYKKLILVKPEKANEYENIIQNLSSRY